MMSSIPFLNGSLLHISIGQNQPGISVCHSVGCAQKGKGSAIVESNTVWQLPPRVKLQNILNYNVGKFTSSKQVFAEGVVFFLICGDKSSPKLPKYSLKARVVCLLNFPQSKQSEPLCCSPTCQRHLTPVNG